MNFPDIKKNIYRVLVIEDESNWYELMEEFLNYYAKKNGFIVEIEITDNCENARKLVEKKLFHAISIDLRLAEKSGGVLISKPSGIELVAELTKMAPLASKQIYTAWAYEHGLELYQDGTCIEDPPAVWEKASSDNEEGKNRYTQKEWAQRILTLILPLSAALEMPLVNERRILKEQLQGKSPLGEGVDFAVKAGRSHLPPGMAQNCSVIHRWLEAGDARYESQAFSTALFLAETLQHWLWVQAGAWLTAMSLQQQIVWPSQTGNGNVTRALMEKSLRAMLYNIAASNKAEWAATWLSHLHISTDGRRMDIVDALAIIRTLRNDYSHKSGKEKLSWEQLALPMRVVLDAAAYLTKYPVLLRPSPAAENRWRFSMLKGEAKTLPEDEWTLAGGELGGNECFAPIRDDQKLYQLWPCPDGSLGLIKLWPFAEQRACDIDGRGVWLLNGLDGRNSKRLWERSAIDGRDNNLDDVPQERLQALKVLRTAN